MFLIFLYSCGLTLLNRYIILCFPFVAVNFTVLHQILVTLQTVLFALLSVIFVIFGTYLNIVLYFIKLFFYSAFLNTVFF